MATAPKCKFVLGGQQHVPASPASSAASALAAPSFKTSQQQNKGRWGLWKPSNAMSKPAGVVGRQMRAPPFASFSLSSLGIHGHHPTHAKPTKYAHDMKKLQGSWVKDKAVSDTMRPAMDIVHLSGVVRQAVKLIRGLQISQNETTWSMSVLSVIGWFKVTEKYPLSGDMIKGTRRDLRRGGYTGSLLANEPGPHGGLMLNIKWGEPYAGEGHDEFVLAPRGTAAKQLAAAAADTTQAADTPASPYPPSFAFPLVELKDGEEDELHVYSSLEVSGQKAAYRTVYHRK